MFARYGTRMATYREYHTQNYVKTTISTIVEQESDYSWMRTIPNHTFFVGWLVQGQFFLTIEVLMRSASPPHTIQNTSVVQYITNSCLYIRLYTNVYYTYSYICTAAAVAVYYYTHRSNRTLFYTTVPHIESFSGMPMLEWQICKQRQQFKKKKQYLIISQQSSSDHQTTTTATRSSSEMNSS